MTLVTKRELLNFIHPHYLFNVLLAFSFVITKTVRPICSIAYSSCTLDHREIEIMVYTAVVVIFRTRKQGAVTLLPYVGTACMLAKVGNVILFFLSDAVYGVVYCVFCLLHILLFPEPCYEGPENVTYFRGVDLETELNKNKKTTWVIELYVNWSPSCIQFAPVFSELSAHYGLDNLRFGKVDLAKNPEIAEKYSVSTARRSKQLPTVILFQEGKETNRRPYITPGNKLVPFLCTYENMVAAFDLNNIFQNCKKALERKEEKEIKQETKKTK